MSSAYKTLHKIKYDNASYVPRDDDAEFLDLVCFYLKKDSFGTFRLDSLEPSIGPTGCLQQYRMFQKSRPILYS